MNLDFIRGSFGDSRRFGWVLGIVIIMLMLIEPESWFTTKPAKEESESTGTSTSSESSKPKASSTTPAPPSATTPAANTQGRPQISWKHLEEICAPPKSPPKQKGMRRVSRR